MKEFPCGWAVAALGEVMDVQGGSQPPKSNFKYEPTEGYVRLLQIRDFGEKPVPTYVPEDSVSKFCEKDDVLIARYGASLGRILTGMNGAYNVALAKTIYAKDLLFHRYVFWLLKTEVLQTPLRMISRSAQNGFARHEIAHVELPIPPLNEQRRIVEKIEAMFDEIDAGIQSLQTARTTLGLYRQSLLKSAFEGRLTADWRAQNADRLEAPETLLARIQAERDTRYKAALDAWQDALAKWRADGEKGKKPAKPKRLAEVKPQHIPEGMRPNFPHQWGATRFGNLNMTVSDGPFGSNLKTSDYTETGIRVIRLENIGYGEFLEEKQSYISEAKYETIKKHSVYPGSIMVSSFVTDAVRSCMVPKSIPLAINKADCFAAVLAGEQALAEFAAYYLQSPQVFDQVEDLVHGVGRPRINTTQLKELHFPVCGEPEQAEIVRILDARLEAADALEAEIDAALTRADALRQSILKKAFSGQLVPQDPTDEPASTLLERINADRARTPKAKKRKVGA